MSSRAGTGRKPKLTRAVQQRVVQALRVGATDKVAAQYAGIAERTFYSWLAKGLAGQAPYVQFVQAIEKAKGRAAIGWLATIEQAANAGNWQAAAWKLERRYPDAYGRRVYDHTHRIQFDTLSEAQLARLAAGESPQTVPGA
jgi:hypothetical protein